jgi:hypothetical protein
VEDSRRSLDEGPDSLARLLGDSAVDDLDALADRLMAESVPAMDRSDDVAMLVVRHQGLPDGHRPVHAQTSVDRVDPRAARAARDFISSFVGDSELVGIRDTCVLLVSEVVTNN